MASRLEREPNVEERTIYHGDIVWKAQTNEDPGGNGPEKTKDVSWTEKEMGPNCSRQDQGLISYETCEATCTSCTE